MGDPDRRPRSSYVDVPDHDPVSVGVTRWRAQPKLALADAEYRRIGRAS